MLFICYLVSWINVQKLMCRSQKRILRYLHGTSKFEIVYRKEDPVLLGENDEDWSDDQNHRKSITGFFSNMASTVVLSHGKWEVALSSCEGEYQGIAAAAQEVSFLRQLLLDLQHPQQQPTSVGEDYHSAIKLSTNPVFHKRSKHIDVKQNFLEMQCKKMKLTSYMCQPKKWQPIFSLKDFVEPNSPSIVRILWAD